MAASTICSIRINSRAFTNQDHAEVINEQEMCFPLVTSSLEWNLFLFFKKLFVYRIKSGFLFYKDPKLKLPVRIWLLLRFMPMKFFKKCFEAGVFKVLLSLQENSIVLTRKK